MGERPATSGREHGIARVRVVQSELVQLQHAKYAQLVFQFLQLEQYAQHAQCIYILEFEQRTEYAQLIKLQLSQRAGPAIEFLQSIQPESGPEFCVRFPRRLDTWRFQCRQRQYLIQ